METWTRVLHAWSFDMELIVGPRFVKILVIEIFSSVLGLFGLIIGLLMSGKALDFSGS